MIFTYCVYDQGFVRMLDQHSVIGLAGNHAILHFTYSERVQGGSPIVVPMAGPDDEKQRLVIIYNDGFIRAMRDEVTYSIMSSLTRPVGRNKAIYFASMPLYAAPPEMDWSDHRDITLVDFEAFGDERRTILENLQEYGMLDDVMKSDMLDYEKPDD